ncbi:MAG: hypothetical protein A2Z38_04085 [Planctomycetes bacterium RBG_19FT_COMBO_48_8]|nr:MAG: hypothetical protein A2Z38_04085 [Planctomycetes bacterium RBG_19FT_COMBO_48_8]
MDTLMEYASRIEYELIEAAMSRLVTAPELIPLSLEMRSAEEIARLRKEVELLKRQLEDLKQTRGLHRGLFKHVSSLEEKEDE